MCGCMCARLPFPSCFFFFLSFFFFFSFVGIEKYMWGVFFYFFFSSLLSRHQMGVGGGGDRVHVGDTVKLIYLECHSDRGPLYLLQFANKFWKYRRFGVD